MIPSESLAQKRFIEEIVFGAVERHARDAAVDAHLDVFEIDLVCAARVVTRTLALQQVQSCPALLGKWPLECFPSGSKGLNLMLARRRIESWSREWTRAQKVCP